MSLLGAILLLLFAAPISYFMQVPELELLLELTAFLIPGMAISNLFDRILYLNDKILIHFGGRALGAVAFFLFGGAVFHSSDEYGTTLSQFLREEKYTQMYSLVGMLVTFLICQVLVAVYYFVMYLLMHNKELGNRKGRMNIGLKSVTVMEVYRKYYASFLEKFLLGAAFVLTEFLVLHVTGEKQLPLQEIGMSFGSGFYLDLILITITYAVMVPVCSKMIGAMKKEDRKHARNYLTSAVHISVVFSVWPIVLCLIDKGLIATITGYTGESLETVIGIGSFSVLFAGLIIIGKAFWHYFNKFYMLIGSLGAFILYVLFLNLFLGKIPAPEAVVYSSLLAIGILGLLLLVLAFKEVGTGRDLLLSVLMPVVSGCICGLVSLLMIALLKSHVTPDILVFATCITGAVLYLAILMFLHNFRDFEYQFLPIVRFLVKRTGRRETYDRR